ncbi:uncharacterized protein A1O9_03336 [Exophiala aquamarina CBS 119918]|uniref:Major facilitator superfamily (MFS) profile domain-containing protein n=1 Tax=Exophiala aquamarina CBS 119918 TaxID=1182545 RepID=A0A072PPJ2_9EURO|nr:uncharacterized protein A1O9_03336 [Exophiala aquamarina CBS 119918]KEF61766.1 hypothetical protein A1O9_03336 [Exophiala aquamarina CBS 119918]
MAEPNNVVGGTPLRALSSRTNEPGLHLTSLESPEENTDVQELEPIDRGRAAWGMLLSAFIFESLLWGFPLSFGVFQNYYSQLPEYANQRYVSIIGTVASGISYMGAPIIIPFLKRTGRYRVYMIWVGWSICILGILASSFARTLGAVIFTQGVMYGVGFTVFYYPIIRMVNEFWVARRGMAYGLLCSASGLSGVFMPLTLEALLKRYGLAPTLRAVAVGLAVCTGPLIPLLRARTRRLDGNPNAATAAPSPVDNAGGNGDNSALPPTPTTDWGFLRVPLFWIYSVSNLMQGLGYFFPALYLPSYATAMGLTATKGALLLSIMSVAQVLGQLSFGYLSDRRFSVNILTLTSTSVSAVAVLALWGLAQKFAMLCIFTVVYGFFAAGYTAMWARMGTNVASDGTAAFAAFGLFNFGKGMGNVLAGPISSGLLLNSVEPFKYGAGRYKAVILFAGSCMLASAACATLSYLRPWKAAAAQR